MALYDEIDGLPYYNEYSNLEGGRSYGSKSGLGGGLTEPLTQKLGGNTFNGRANLGAITNALNKFNSSFEQVDLPQRSLNNATDFGRPGSSIDNAVNTGTGRFDDVFENVNSIFSRYY